MRFLRHDALDEAVCAMRKCGAVLAHGTVHETQVLKQEELSIGIEPVESFPTRVFLERLRDVEDVILRHRSRGARSVRMKPIRICLVILETLSKLSRACNFWNLCGIEY